MHRHSYSNSFRFLFFWSLSFRSLVWVSKTLAGSAFFGEKFYGFTDLNKDETFKMLVSKFGPFRFSFKEREDKRREGLYTSV